MSACSGAGLVLAVPASPTGTLPLRRIRSCAAAWPLRSTCRPYAITSPARPSPRKRLPYLRLLGGRCGTAMTSLPQTGARLALSDDPGHAFVRHRTPPIRSKRPCALRRPALPAVPAQDRRRTMLGASRRRSSRPSFVDGCPPLSGELSAEARDAGRPHERWSPRHANGRSQTRSGGVENTAFT